MDLTKKDERIVYGANCAWWDSIHNVGVAKISRHRLPVCPKCGSPLFEVENEIEWWDGVEKYEANGHPGYRDFTEWLRGKCFRSIKDARKVYDAELSEDRRR